MSGPRGWWVGRCGIFLKAAIMVCWGWVGGVKCESSGVISQSLLRIRKSGWLESLWMGPPGVFNL